jgi:AraC-like DNA-binding protein
MYHIGNMIKAELDRHPKAHTVTWFAAQLHCDRTNVYDIFRRQTIDSNLLMRISQILNHDFFLDLSCEMKKAKH